MVQKIPIVPDRVRRVPRQFSWVDHRLVRERRIDNCSHPAAALYLFLVTVGDARGMSYYADGSIFAKAGKREPRARRSDRVEETVVSGPVFG